MKIAILGAECTGKTQLAQDLVPALTTPSSRAVWIPEVLRAWCVQHQRTPAREEQQAIAQAQALQVETAANADWLLADTAPLMTAIYSDLLFGDLSLYAFALEHQRGYDLTLVTGLDLPWVGDGIQRQGAQVQAMVDTRLREVLQKEALRYTVVYGMGPERTACALQAIHQHRKTPAAPSRQSPAWNWSCEKCSDAVCEHQLFSRLTQASSMRV